MKYTVHLMHPVLSWENVEADSEEDAIKLCQGEESSLVGALDANEPTTFLAIEEEADDG